MLWYNAGIALYECAIRAAARFKPKARAWSEGRRGIFERMAATIRPEEKIVWIHAASLGEFEQGRPIIEMLRRESPERKILLTFFSPSGYEIRKNYPGADYIFYLPSDRPRNVRRFLDIVDPEIAVFIKYEFWLNYLGELRRRGCRTLLVSAIFRRNSIFFRPYGGAFRKALRGFERIFVQNAESAELLHGIGIDDTTVAGDTRFDRVADIAAAARRIEKVETFRNGRRLFVAGSTWGPDEEILLPLINANPDIKFVVAPHEMEEERIERLLNGSRGGAVRYTRCDDPEQLHDAQVLVVDTVGILSSIYGYAEAAYIGGGFGVGIHNTLEAATFGLPVAFGPNYAKFREARELIACGAARSVKSAEELAAWYAPLKSDGELLAATGRKAADYVAANRGATRKIVDFILRKG